MQQGLPHVPGYRIAQQLYAGSRTVVYRGVRLQNGLPVVVKLLRNPLPSFNEWVQFCNQYAIAKALDLPNVVKMLALETGPHAHFLVMEDCGGISLQELLGRAGNLGGSPQTLTTFLRIAIQMATALEGLYEHRVIHKDIKPANILVHPETRQVNLIDFSIASQLPRETQEIRAVNALEGTLAYLSPEQTGRMNRGIDYRSDFYSLGVTFYELLTGQLPYVSDDPMELIHSHLAKRPVPVHHVNAYVPLVVSAIVSKLMAKNAEDRYQSALGLKHDLETCLQQLGETGTISEFAVGQHDVSDRFLIPEKLYGREQEVQRLLHAFAQVASGGSELMLVAGFSGIGKTAVVNEVHKPIVRQRGYFIKGKFDQFNRNIPLSAFVQALRDLMGQLLSESDTQLEQWKTQILAAVGGNGQVLMEVIPELEQIIGKQPIATELSGSAAQNRFNVLFQKFIEVFTTADHPLVLFLDDLQWADLASLQLLKLLMNDKGYLLLLGAYRDNEVSPAHPFIMTVVELQKARKTVNTITLAPLALEDINHLVADTLNYSTELAQPLTELVNRRTQGNPFFTTQFLKALHDDGHIRFVGGSHSQGEYHNHRYWECDIAQVSANALTDDVVEFMALQLQKLPAATQQVLKLAACVGNQLDLAQLAIVSERSPTDVSTALWEALQKGLILPRNQVYKFFGDGLETQLRDRQGKPEAEHSSTPLITYRFVHDRVQQAAYSLISEHQKAPTHLKIGRTLLAAIASTNVLEPQNQQLFLCVNQLNLGRTLIEQQSEQVTLAQMNLDAGQAAIASTAYDTAVDYCRIGIELLPADAWEQLPDLTRALHQAGAQSACLCGQFQAMDQWIDTALNHSVDFLATLPLQDIRLQALKLQSRLPESVVLGRSLLAQLGITFPVHPQPQDIVGGLQVIQQQLKEQSIQSLLDRPAIADPHKRAASYLLLRICPAAFLSDPLLFPLLVLAQTQLGLESGHAAPHTHGYANYAMLVGGMLGDQVAAYEFGQLALQLVEQYNARELAAMTRFLVSLFTEHWQCPTQQIATHFQETYTIAVETGDYEHANYSALFYCQHLYLAGTDLITVQAEMERYRAWITKSGEESISMMIHQSNYQLVLSLQGQIPALTFPPDWEQMDSRVPMFNHYLHNQLVYCYLWGDYQTAQRIVPLLDRCDPITRSMLVAIVTQFYAVLTDLALYLHTPSAEQRALDHRIQAQLTQFKQRADQMPMNFQHKYDLIAAEYQRVLGEKAAAIDLYDRAIAGAKANGYTQEEALANELAAKFYLDWGKEKIAQEYLMNAYYGYAHWGTDAKIQQLERQYPILLAPIFQQQQRALSAPETMFTTTSLNPSQTPGTQSSRLGHTSISATLDLATVLKASQTLSSEIQLDKLLATLLHTVLENAGADKGVLLMPRDNEWFVEALATVDQPAQVQSIALSSSSELPHSLINTVKHSQKPIVIVDAAAHPTLAMDAYVVERQPKSLLCTPILNQGKLAAILYLENHAVVGAFTHERVELLNLLCTQAAISLENARFYSQIQKSQRQLTQLLNNLTGIAYSCANDEHWTMHFISGGCLNLTGYEIEDFINNYKISYVHLINPDDAEMVDRGVQEAIKNHQPYQLTYRIRTKQGEEKWVWEQGQGVFDQDGALLGLEGFVTDISDRKQAEIALQEKEAEYRSIFETVRDGLSICDLETGQIVAVNPTVCQMFGYSPEEWLNLTPVDFMHPDSLPAFSNFLEILNAGKEYYSHAVGKHKEGYTFDVEAKAVPFIYKGKLHGLSIIRDISDRKRAEAQIQRKNQELEQALTQLQQSQAQVVQSEKMSALGNLVAGVAHEINNPIGFLNGSINNAQEYVQDLLDYLALYQQHHPNAAAPVQDKAEEIDLEFLSEDLPKLLGSMQGATDRIKGISTSLRTFSRTDTEHKVSANLHEGIDSTILILKYRLKANHRRPAIEVIQDYGDLPSVDCFPGQLNQVFMNILANAIDVFDEVAQHTSFADLKTHPQTLTICTRQTALSEVTIRIGDNGPGMTAAVKDRIFEYLFTTKEVGKGTGLGLAIARQIVEEKHGGAITVQSTPGQGTEFTITLPLQL